MDINRVVALNLSAWMDVNPGLDTLKKLAAKSGVGFGTIRRAKNGDGNITIQNLEAIAHAFGRHAADLMTAPDIDHLTPKADAQQPADNLLRLLPAEHNDLSPAGQRLIARLADLDRSGQSPPALYALIENAIALIHPRAGGNDYPGLNDL